MIILRVGLDLWEIIVPHLQAMLKKLRGAKQLALLLDNKLLFSCFFVCFSAILGSFANKPLGYFPLAFITLVPLWCLIIVSKDRKKVILYSLCWGYIYHGISLSWILGMRSLDWLGIPWFLSLLFALFYWFLVSSLGAIFLIVWGLGLHFLTVKKYNVFTQISVTGSLWISLELLFQNTPFWWTTLALTQSPNNLWLIQLNKFSGIATTVFIILIINGLIANLIISNSQKQKINLLKLTTKILLIAHLLGAIIYYFPPKQSETDKIQIGIVQGNIPLDLKFKSAGIELAVQRYSAGYNQLADQGVDAVLTPELAIPPLGRVKDIKSSPFFEATVKNQKIPFWIGARTGSVDHPKQSLVVVDQTGFASQYDKQKLVLFGEKIPLAGTPAEAIIKKVYPFKVNHLEGKPDQVFTTPHGQAAIAICYESAYPQILLKQVRSGAKYILVASADGLFRKNMMMQHHAQDVLRAIETGRWLVRANSTDSSGGIDNKGNTLWLSQAGYQVGAIPIYLSANKTLYVRWGDWLTPVLASFSFYRVSRRN